MIDRNKSRRRKPRIGHRRNSNLKVYNNQHNNAPKSRSGISKALEKFTSLAQDAHSNGDRIVAENFYQYAEHYQRLLNEEFGFDSKKTTKDDLKGQDDNTESENNLNSAKPSRTQRAIDGKNNRLNNKTGESDNLHKTKKENFTSDGIEALKPFETSISEKKTQSS